MVLHVAAPTWCVCARVCTGDLPYALRVTCAGLVECLGRVTVSGPAGRSFTAHPKLCSKTGEVFWGGGTSSQVHAHI